MTNLRARTKKQILNLDGSSSRNETREGRASERSSSCFRLSLLLIILWILLWLVIRHSARGSASGSNPSSLSQLSGADSSVRRHAIRLSFDDAGQPSKSDLNHSLLLPHSRPKPPSQQDLQIPQKQYCACGDRVDLQLSRCLMMDPAIVLWVSGHGPKKDGEFLMKLVPHLSGTIRTSRTFQSANCHPDVGTPASLAKFSYSFSDARKMHAIYKTCKGATMQLKQCLRAVDESLLLGQEMFLSGSTHSVYSSNLHVTNICAEPGWCFTSVTPGDIHDSIQTIDSDCIDESQVRLSDEVRTRDTKVSIVPFLRWNTSSIQSYATWPSSSDRIRPDKTSFVRGWNESFAHLRRLWRCGQHFSMVRFGDGELNVMLGKQYSSETDLTNWTHKPKSYDIHHQRFRELMLDGFKLAKEHSRTDDFAMGGMYIGLPFYFCAEGMGGFHQGGGGHFDWLWEFLSSFSGTLSSVSAERMSYSWQWAHLNYASSMRLLRDMSERDGRLILICHEQVSQGKRPLPSWVGLVLTVPGNGIEWSMRNLALIEEQAKALASSVKNRIFIFAAGPVSNILIPLMCRTNPQNTYLDFGSTLDYEVHGVRTRPFHPLPNTTLRPWLKSDGSLQKGQNCHETRWDVHFDPKVVPVDARHESTLESGPVQSRLRFGQRRQQDLNPLAVNVGLPRSGNLERKDDGVSMKDSDRCACGDLFDEVTSRCYMGGAETILWIGGYGGDGYSHDFVSGILQKESIEIDLNLLPGSYSNANCFMKKAPSTLNLYSYEVSDAASMDSIYSTCKVIPPSTRACLAPRRPDDFSHNPSTQSQSSTVDNTTVSQWTITKSCESLRSLFVFDSKQQDVAHEFGLSTDDLRRSLASLVPAVPVTRIVDSVLSNAAESANFSFRQLESACGWDSNQSSVCSEPSRASVGAITVCKNEESTIVFAVGAALDHLDYYHVVDMGSTDRTVLLLERFFSRYISEGKLVLTRLGTSKGIAFARNLALNGARLAGCSHVIKIDADDVFYEEGIEAVVRLTRCDHSRFRVLWLPQSELFQDHFGDSKAWIKGLNLAVREPTASFWELADYYYGHDRSFTVVPGLKAEGKWTDEADGGKPENFYYPSAAKVAFLVSKPLLVHYGWARPRDRIKSKVAAWEHTGTYKHSHVGILERLNSAPKKPFFRHPQIVQNLTSAVLTCLTSNACPGLRISS